MWLTAICTCVSKIRKVLDALKNVSCIGTPQGYFKSLTGNINMLKIMENII